MAELTPEEIKREQERLNLIQQQTAAAKELVSTYEKLSKVSTANKQQYAESLDISKKIMEASDSLAKSAELRINKSSSLKDLEKSLQKLADDSDKSRSINVKKLSADRSKALEQALQLGKQEKSLQKDLAAEYAYQDNILSVIDRLKGSTEERDKELLKLAKEELRSSNAALNIIENKVKKTTEQKDQQKELYTHLCLFYIYWI